MIQTVFETSIGDISAELYHEKAPVTAAFFEDLVSLGHYEDGDLYRSTQLGIEDGPFLLQGGASLPYLQNATLSRQTPMLDQIETTKMTGILHKRGTLSLARDLNRTGHALAEFFICLGDFPSLDESGRNLPDTKGFPAFGQVLSGLEILDDIAAQETGGHTHLPLLKGQMLTSPIKIKRVYLSG